MAAWPREVSSLGPVPVFDHLLRLTDERAMFTHAQLSVPSREHGYCMDDVAQGLIVVCREPDSSFILRRLERQYLDFVLAGIRRDGACHERMDADGTWLGEAGVGDSWGRAVGSLGVAAAGAHSETLRSQAREGFRRAARQRSPDVRSMAYAALGAAEFLRVQPLEPSAADVLSDAIAAIVPADLTWLWPEPRLPYRNGTVAEALIIGGAALGNDAAFDGGLALLIYLLRAVTRDGHLSMTPLGGEEVGIGPLYDQRPVDVAALAGACASAYRQTEEPMWLTGVRLAWNWFLGRNDAATPMFDPETGGAYDGLGATVQSRNQGAASTLAMIATAQTTRWVSWLR
jgi:hypothetical protein